uniref:Ig-like domain-containing protein n=1 Tax=Malurus cyaneus samueli TaxID=2593467 RepID=A0A8C5UDQ4_9PASS
MSRSVLLHWILIQTFIAHTVCDTVIRAVAGRPVVLPCFYRVTRRRDISDMCWGRGPCPNSKCSNKILHTTGSRVTFRTSQRYDLQGSVSYGDVSLTIGTAKAEDAGIYCCRVEIPGLFNDIKKNIRLQVARAPPVTTTTTRKAPVSSTHFTETTFAPQTTPGVQPIAETTVLLTTSTSTPVTTASEPPAVTTGEIFAPPTTAVTENDIFPVTVVETSTLQDFSTTSQAADVTTEDDMFFFTLPGSTEVTTEFPSTIPSSVTAEFPGALPAAEETSVMMEEMPFMEVSAKSDGSAAKHEDRGYKFPSSAILAASVIAGCVLFALMVSLVWKRKHAKKVIIKSAGPPEGTEKVFSGAEGENNIFSL